MPLLRRRAVPPPCRPRAVAARQLVRRARRTWRGRRPPPPARLSSATLFLVQVSGERVARRHSLAPTPTSPPTRTAAGARPPLLAWRWALRPDRFSQWSRWRSTTATCSRWFVERAASRCSASSRRATCEAARRWASHAVRFFGTQLARELAAGHPRRPAGGQQRARPRADAQRLRRRPGAAACRRAGCSPWSSPTCCADGRGAVRHHLPRALLVFSFTTVRRVFAAHGLTLFDVEELSTHGGSLRIFACHAGYEGRPVESRVAECWRAKRAPASSASPPTAPSPSGARGQARPRPFLLAGAARRASRSSATALLQGQPLLNYCGVRGDLLPYTVDRIPHKQGGTSRRGSPSSLPTHRRDASGLRPHPAVEPQGEVMAQMAHVRGWAGPFVVAVPRWR